MFRRKIVKKRVLQTKKMSCLVITKALQKKLFGVWFTQEKYEIEIWHVRK
jgi:hypothetical protein